MVALSRPRHFFFFALVLTGLFGITFQVTQAVHEAPTADPETLPTLLEGAAAGSVPIMAPEPLPDLLVADFAARECLSSDPGRPGGTVTLVVRNAGEGTARGFALFVGLDVRNVDSGDALQEERDVWIDELRPGGEVVVQLAYRFPQRDTLLVGSLAVGQPVPGSYRLEASLDRPSALPAFGDAGILEEADEHNNFASTHTDGTADGIC